MKHVCIGILRNLLLGTLLIGCALDKEGKLGVAGMCAEPPENKAKRLHAFETTLHPLTGTHGCVQCHVSGGSAPYPFADATIESAYTAAAQVADLQSAATSRMVVKVGTELHQCGSNPTTCAAISHDLEEQIAAWAAQIASLPTPICEDTPGAKFLTNTKKLQASDLSMSEARKFRWDFPELPSGYGNLDLEFSAQLYAQPVTGLHFGAYVLTKPILATSTKKLRVQSISMILNGEPATQYTNFVDVNFVVAPMSYNVSAQPWGFPAVSSFQQLVNFESESGDNIAWEVTAEETTDPEGGESAINGCLESAEFDRKVRTPWTNKCIRCHAGANAAASAAFSLNPNSDWCSESLKKTNLTSPINSYLFRKARDGDGGHERPLNDNNENTKIMEWMQAEADAR